MAVSTVKLYSACRIQEDKNFQVDSLESYLTGLSPYVVNNFQYVKQANNLTIKINLPQSELNGDQDFNDNYNYISIKNSNDSKTYYYFITAKKWLSTSAVEYTLKQDVINTWQGTYDLTKKTKILRQHKDRLEHKLNEEYNIELSNSVTSSDWIRKTGTTGYFVYVNFQSDSLISATIDVDDIIWGIHPYFQPAISVVSKTFDSETGTIQLRLEHSSTPSITIAIETKYTYNALVRVIDRVPEGLMPTLVKDTTKDVTLEEDIPGSWSLVYETEVSTAENPPVKCYAYPETEFTCYTHGGRISIEPGDLQANKNYYFYTGPSGASYDILDGGNNVIAEVLDGEGWGKCAGVRVVNNQLTITEVVFSSGGGSRVIKTTSGIAEITLTASSDVTYTLDNKRYIWPVPTAISSNTVKSIYSVDRTKAELIKIIKIPYSPLVASPYSNGLILEGTNWKYNASRSCFELEDVDQKFAKTINWTNQYNPYKDLLLFNITPNVNATRDDTYESKLYSSEFYNPKFVYDSFSFPFALEKMDTEAYCADRQFNIDYRVTSTINSKFAFLFPEYTLKASTSDYDNVVTIARNNEMTIYNSEYLNYIKTGYNYDKKAKNTQLGVSIAKTGVSVVGGAVAGAVAGSSAGPAGIAVGAVIGLASGIISTVASQVTAQDSIDRKLTELSNQAASVAGSDDIDLLEAYSGNKAKMVTYDTPDYMKSLIGDLFYYCGYAVNKQGIPNTTSRYWFNFIQCEPDIAGHWNMNGDELNSLVEKYKQGITVLHKRNNTWDFDQTKENWETSLL